MGSQLTVRDLSVLSRRSGTQRILLPSVHPLQELAKQQVAVFLEPLLTLTPLQIPDRDSAREEIDLNAISRILLFIKQITRLMFKKITFLQHRHMPNLY